MIRVDVENYCQSCLDFQSDVVRPIRAYREGNGEAYWTDTIVQCEHRKRCANIKRYLEQQTKGEACG